MSSTVRFQHKNDFSSSTLRISLNPKTQPSPIIQSSTSRNLANRQNPVDAFTSYTVADLRLARKKFYNEYFDLNVLGLGDNECVNAVVDPASAFTPQVQLPKILKASSFADAVFFTNSGNEANEAAIKFTRKFQTHSNPSATQIISCSNSLDGRTMAALALRSREQNRSGFEPVTVVEFGNIGAARESIQRGKTAAVFVKPLQGAGGIYSASKHFLEFLLTACDDSGALLVFDETHYGLGITGHLWAHGAYGVFPDIMTLGEPLADGLPIGAVLATERVASAINFGHHGGTFTGGSPICNATLVVLEKISNPAFLARVSMKGLRFKKVLRQKFGGNSHVKEIRGLGLIIGIELDVPVLPLIDACRNFGLLILVTGKGNVMRLELPLFITEQELDLAAEILEMSLSVLDESI